MQLPKADQRTCIVGSTGSGKTFFAVWLLSTRDWLKRPWIIFDFKRDNLIGSLGAIEIDIRGQPPKRPGLYFVRPIPNIDDAYVTQMLWRIWEQEYLGVFIDEGYMIGRNDPGLSALLTQGRSKLVEMITCVQRPVNANKLIFSEADNYSVMRLNIIDDRKYMANYLNGKEFESLPKFHALWYSASEARSYTLGPVPQRQELIARFAILEEQPRRHLI